MQVTLRYQTTVSADVAEGSVTFKAAASREFGSASVRIPRGSPLWNRQAMAPHGGSLMTVALYGEPRPWVGLTDVPAPDQGDMLLGALSLEALFAGLTVRTSARLTAVTAGTVALLAMRACLPAIGLRAGVAVEAAPLLDYTLSGQSLAQVFADLMDRTGQEWQVGRDGAVDWVAAAGQATASEHLWPLAATVQQVSEPPAAVTLDGNWPVAMPDAGGEWGRVVASGSPVQAARRFTVTVPRPTVAMGVVSDTGSGWDSPWDTMPWSSGGVTLPGVATSGQLAPGDVTLLHVPTLGLSTAARVMGRTVDAASSWVTLDLLEVVTSEQWPGSISMVRRVADLRRQLAGVA